MENSLAKAFLRRGDITIHLRKAMAIGEFMSELDEFRAEKMSFSGHTRKAL